MGSAARTTCAVAAAILASVVLAAGTPPEVLKLEGDLAPVHDPVVIRERDSYYVFSTGGRPGQGVVPIRTSKDMRTWTLSGYVYESLPEWALAEIPKASNAWAPDISHFNGKFHLYYSVSSFGSRNSAIGLTTTSTLDPASADYRWQDQGMVLRSHEESDDWNAIDPNLFIEDADKLWLSWGSFWGGIKMRRVDPDTGKLSGSDVELHSLASRRPRQPPAIEAPFIVRRDGYYYLFVSFDLCCRGKDSTYKIMVGRALRITGPYRDRDDRPMMEGGGTLVLEGTRAWRGPGHPAVLFDSNADLLVFHAYEGTTGRATLRISTLAWEDGWPRAGRLE